MTSDSFDRTVYHRSVIANDTPLITLAERVRLEGLERSLTGSAPLKRNAVNGLLTAKGAGNIEFAFYGLGNDNGTFSATIIGLPAILQHSLKADNPKGPRPLRLALLALTLGTSTETDLNPINGKADTGTWRAADTCVVTVAGTGIKVWDGETTGTNSVVRAVVDPLQLTHLFCYIHALTNVTRVIVQARRVTRFNPFG